MNKIIENYHENGYSLLPLKNNSKLPCIKWKQYQYKRPSLEDILDWFINFNEPNIGLITGDISRLIVIDLDNYSLLPELKKILPDTESTTRVKTKGGYHFYFINNNEHKIKSINNLFNMGIELKGNGRYVVAPPSIVEGHRYSFEVPLSEIQPLPNIIIEQLGEGKILPDVVKKKRLILPRYNGLGVSCITQILGKNLPVGERDNSLFILYNLLLQNKNTKDHSKRIVILKNNSLTKPLIDRELENVFKKPYNYRCSSIREALPYVNCDNCEFKFKGGNLEVGNILIKNIRKFPELSNTEAKIALMLGTYFDGENPSNYELAKKTGMNKNTVKEAVEGLKNKDII